MVITWRHLYCKCLYWTPLSENKELKKKKQTYISVLPDSPEKNQLFRNDRMNYWSNPSAVCSACSDAVIRFTSPCIRSGIGLLMKQRGSPLTSYQTRPAFFEHCVVLSMQCYNLSASQEAIWSTAYLYDFFMIFTFNNLQITQSQAPLHRTEICRPVYGFIVIVTPT